MSIVFCVNIKFLYLQRKYLAMIWLGHTVCVYLIMGKSLIQKGYLYNLKVFFFTKYVSWKTRKAKGEDRTRKLNATCDRSMSSEETSSNP